MLQSLKETYYARNTRAQNEQIQKDVENLVRTVKHYTVRAAASDTRPDGTADYFRR